MALAMPARIVQGIDPLVVHIDHFDHDVFQVELFSFETELSIGDIEVFVEYRHQLTFCGSSVFHRSSHIRGWLGCGQNLFSTFFVLHLIYRKCNTIHLPIICKCNTIYYQLIVMYYLVLLCIRYDNVLLDPDNLEDTLCI